MFGKKKVTSFEKLTLSISGMRANFDYEMINKGDAAEVSYYMHVCTEEGWGRRLEKRVECPVGEALEQLDACGVYGWNGFSGKHPRGVLDGLMFRLEGVVNGERIYASGSQNFPKGFRELRDWFYLTLNGKE